MEPHTWLSCDHRRSGPPVHARPAAARERGGPGPLYLRRAPQPHGDRSQCRSMLQRCHLKLYPPHPWRVERVEQIPNNTVQ